MKNNEAMIGSYVIIDPMGRFYQNSDNNTYMFIRSILKIGVFNALNDIHYNFAKFLERGGLYTW